MLASEGTLDEEVEGLNCDAFQLCSFSRGDFRILIHAVLLHRINYTMQ